MGTKEKAVEQTGEKVGGLAPSGYNPRKITKEALALLGKSMKEFGDLSGIVYNRRTKRIVGGHQRMEHLDPEWPVIKTAMEDGLGTVAVGYIQTPNGQWTYREVDWDEKREIAANIAANKHGGYFDIPSLKDLIAEIDTGDMDIQLTGFTSGELVELFAYGTSDDKEELEDNIATAAKVGKPKGKEIHWLWVDMPTKGDMQAVMQAIGSSARREIDATKLIDLLKETGKWPTPSE